MPTAHFLPHNFSAKNARVDLPTLVRAHPTPANHWPYEPG